jgi:hypothetical protein
MSSQQGSHGESASPEVSDLPAVKAVLPAEDDLKDACDICRSTGLAILPVRYTVVPDACPDAGLGILRGGRACAEAIAASGYKYALRTLRQGMLYLFYEQGGPYGPRHWEAYSVAENGTLWRQPSAFTARAVEGAGLPACSRNAHDPMRTEFITIQRPHLCGTVWLAFSQHVWTPATLDRYATDEKLRAERMQPITPATWIQSPASTADYAPINDASLLSSIMEYRQTKDPAKEPAELPHFAAPRAISRSDGTFFGEVLRANATRYPWSRRTRWHDANAAEPLQDRYQLLCTHSSNGRVGENRKNYAPMLIGLWDAVGVVHELNGYCHDVIGNIERYKQERALELNAVGHIEQICSLLELNGAVLSDNYAKASLAELERLYEERRSRPRYTTGGRKVEPALSEEDKKQFTDHLSRALLPLYQQEARDKWNKKYWPLIDEPSFRAFKGNVEVFMDAALSCLEPRTRALGSWLRNELFLVTLEDFDGTSPGCGLRFEEVVTNAIEGLGISREGRRILTLLSANTHVTRRECLLWRVIAQNQDDARQELEQTLAEANAHRDLALNASGAAWLTFVSATSHLKKYLDYYRKFEAAQKEAVPTTAADRILRDSGVDRFVTTAGAFMLNCFPLKGIQDKAGNAMVRFVFYTRALMSAEEASDLISKEAGAGVEVKRYFLDRVNHYRSRKITQGTPMMFALRDVERHHGTRLMQQRWKTAADSSRNVVRLNSLTGVLELVNFINLSLKADKRARDYATLLASGMSLIAVYTSISEGVSKEFYGSASRSVGRMKVVGGLAGGAGSFIGAVYDMGEVSKASKDQRYGATASLFIKALAGGSIGSAQFLTALAYSSPVIKRVVGSSAVTIALDGIKAGLTAATSKGAESALASQSMKRIGVWILRLGGWKAALAMAAIEGTVWALSPNDLELWCEENAFGRVKEGWLFGIGESGPKFRSAKEQEETFMAAMGSVSTRSSEASTADA